MKPQFLGCVALAGSLGCGPYLFAPECGAPSSVIEIDRGATESEYGEYLPTVLISIDDSRESWLTLVFSAADGGGERLTTITAAQDNLEHLANVLREGEAFEIYAGHGGCDCDEFEVVGSDGRLVVAGFGGSARTWLGGQFEIVDVEEGGACRRGEAIEVEGALRGERGDSFGANMASSFVLNGEGYVLFAGDVVTDRIWAAGSTPLDASTNSASGLLVRVEE